MPITERFVDPPDHWPDANQLRSATVEDALVVLPEDLRTVDGVPTAFFRTDAQALRAQASTAGFTPILLKPEGTAVAGYSEYAADWVLPAIVAASLTIPATVVADLIHDALTSDVESSARIVKYREAVLDGDRVQVREIEGPAAEVERLLRERGATLRLPTASPTPAPAPTPDPK